MIAILIFIAIVIGLNCIPLLTKTNFPKTEKAISKISLITILIFLIFTVLSFSGYKLKGLYSNSLIGLIFIIVSLVYFVLVKNSLKKILTVVIIVPLILLSFYIFLFERTIEEYKITDKFKITLSTGGFLGCGDNIEITKTTLGIFDKEIYDKNNLCLLGIYNIETVEFNNKYAVFLIYHNGDRDSENPYRCKIENKNVW